MSALAEAMALTELQRFRCVLIGDSGVGKSTFMSVVSCGDAKARAPASLQCPIYVSDYSLILQATLVDTAGRSASHIAYASLPLWGRARGFLSVSLSLDALDALSLSLFLCVSLCLS